MVLILKNIPKEGPGTIEGYLRENNRELSIIDLSVEEIPGTLNFDTLIIMGGPMSVNESALYPYIPKEIELVRKCIDKGKKVLGICLGAQIIASALGSRVYAGPEKEIGWYDIELTGEGMRDQLMTRLAMHPKTGDLRKRFRVFHWHGETFDVPAGTVHLARSEQYPNQAFSYGNNVYAFQFHIEVTRDMIFDWLKDEPIDHEKLRKDTAYYYDDYSGRAANFYKGFLARAGRPAHAQSS